MTLGLFKCLSVRCYLHLHKSWHCDYMQDATVLEKDGGSVIKLKRGYDGRLFEFVPVLNSCKTQ